jgi:thiol-disulfide isomerase/thioredoxin
LIGQQPVAKKFRDKGLIAFVALTALAGGYFLYFSLPRSSDISQLTSENFYDLSGNPSKIDDWDGNVRVVNFWATWCAPCREEIPGFVRLQREYGDKGVVFIGIAVDDREKVAQFAADIGMNYPVLIAEFGAMELSRTAGNRLQALPFTMVLNRDGELAHAFSGIVKEERLERELRRIL